MTVKFLMGKMRSSFAMGILTVGTICCLMLVTADVSFAAAYATKNGQVMIEAENYTRLGGSLGGRWTKSKSISGYSGSGYMQAPSGSPRTLTYKSSNTRVEYDINFQETGTYYLHLRTHASTHSNNGLFATMNGRKFNYGHSRAYYIAVPWMNKWWCYADGGGAEGRGYKISINISKKGVQTLAIVRRDKGSRVDRIWLTKHVRTSPKASNFNGSSSTPTSVGSSNSSSTTDKTTNTQTTPSDSTTTVSGGAVTQSANGLVVLNARKYNAKASRSNHNWAAVNHLGTGAMEAIPDNGARFDSGYVSKSPYLRFNVRFTKTGTHYVWLQASCLGRDNTAHVGLNGNAVASAARVNVPVSKGWAWSGKTARGSRVKINVTKTGVQTVEVYMREDGMILRQVVLATSSNYSPAGQATTDGISSGSSSDNSVTVTGKSFQQKTDANGLVVMNAKNHSARTSRSNHNWAAVNHLGVGAMEAIPDNGARFNTNYVSNSPYLRFNVNFKKTGIHYIWLRASCLGRDNTAHVGLNGNAVASAARVNVPVSKGWAWSGKTASGSRVKINVTKTGVQTVEVYMREDGMVLHKMVITKSSNYTPSGSGPAQSVLK